MTSSISNCPTLSSDIQEDGHVSHHYCVNTQTQVRRHSAQVTTADKTQVSAFWSQTFARLRKSMQHKSDKVSDRSASANANVNEACVRHSTISSTEKEEYV